MGPVPRPRVAAELADVLKLAYVLELTCVAAPWVDQTKVPQQRLRDVREAGSTVAGTVHVCSSCHGPDGRSSSPTFPRLAGQQKDYIVAQLQAFRDKTRADPHAQTYMWGMAARLSDATIDGIATYYGSLLYKVAK